MSALHTLTQSAKAAAAGAAPQENKLITNLILIPLLFSLQWRAITKRRKNEPNQTKGGREGEKKQAQHKTKEAITAKIK